MQAKTKYDWEERKAAEARARGENSWMLPELGEKITSEAKVGQYKLQKRQFKARKCHSTALGVIS